MHVSLWGGALSRALCACSHVEGTCLGTHSELNPRTIGTYERLKTTRTLHGRVFKSSIYSLSLLGSSSITCACEFISGLWGGALSKILYACSHVEGACIGTHSELNPQTFATYKRLKTTLTRHGRVLKSSNLLSLSLSLPLSRFLLFALVCVVHWKFGTVRGMNAISESR